MITLNQSIGNARPSLRIETGDILRITLRHVIHLSETGDLPLFTWTLGLPQAALAATLEARSLPSWHAESIPPNEYSVIEKMVPRTFHTLRSRLLQFRTRSLDTNDADHLSRAIAAACFGSRQLWQDLGLHGERELASLLATYFKPLHQKNKRNTKWKRFLFSELHETSEHWSSIREMLLKCLMQRK